MKVRIQDFGPVGDFTFDTDTSFHLIVGDNNVGKSYALTAYYFIIKTLLEVFDDRMTSMRSFIYYKRVEGGEEKALPENLSKILASRLQLKKPGDIDVTEIYMHYFADFLQETLGSEFSNKIKSSYSEHDSVANSFSGASVARITISLPLLEIVLEGNVDEFRVVSVVYTYRPVLRLSKQNRQPMYSGQKYVIYRHAEESVDDLGQKLKYLSYSRCNLLMRVSVENIVDIDYLPASRSGLYQALSAFGQIIAQLSKSRSFLSAKIELPGISGQLSDYFIKLNNIKPVDAEINSDFARVAEAIEQSILKGTIEYDYKDKRLYYTPAGTKLRLDLSATSSMVSETAPIVAYIRHIIAWRISESKRPRRARTPIKQNKILIIEEPEAHLHPDNQIKMTEIYAELAKIGVNVLVTSHSNYVFNKLSNLVIEKKLRAASVRCDLFQMQEKGSVGLAQKIDDFGIDDKNFVDASERLFNERMELIENMDV